MKIKLLTYNIQSWDMNERRKLGVVDLIKKHNPDVICLQEVTVKWFSLLKKELSDTYAFCGRDRFHGDKNVIEWRRERNCVLYRKDRFSALYNHTYWFNGDIKKRGLIEEAEYPRAKTRGRQSGILSFLFQVRVARKAIYRSSRSAEIVSSERAAKVRIPTRIVSSFPSCLTVNDSGSVGSNR